MISEQKEVVKETKSVQEVAETIPEVVAETVPEPIPISEMNAGMYGKLL